MDCEAREVTEALVGREYRRSDRIEVESKVSWALSDESDGSLLRKRCSSIREWRSSCRQGEHVEMCGGEETYPVDDIDQ